MGLYKSQVRGKEETGSPEKQKMAGKPELHQPNNHGEAGHPLSAFGRAGSRIQGDLDSGPGLQLGGMREVVEL